MKDCPGAFWWHTGQVIDRHWRVATWSEASFQTAGRLRFRSEPCVWPSALRTSRVTPAAKRRSGACERSSLTRGERGTARRPGVERRARRRRCKGSWGRRGRRARGAFPCCGSEHIADEEQGRLSSPWGCGRNTAAREVHREGTQVPQRAPLRAGGWRGTEGGGDRLEEAIGSDDGGRQAEAGVGEKKKAEEEGGRRANSREGRAQDGTRREGSGLGDFGLRRLGA
ncbi:hypothetical protein FGB62_24g231 [Gracilaria domingensis]|nr:hypothetical protein FGB62_24g231 [Gracilaria domingensis]